MNIFHAEKALRPHIEYWESAFRRAGSQVSFDSICACPGCGDKHLRVYFESEWNDEEVEAPGQSYTIDLYFHLGEDTVSVGTAYFENGRWFLTAR